MKPVTSRRRGGAPVEREPRAKVERKKEQRGGPPGGPTRVGVRAWVTAERGLRAHVGVRAAVRCCAGTGPPARPPRRVPRSRVCPGAETPRGPARLRAAILPPPAAEGAEGLRGSGPGPDRPRHRRPGHPLPAPPEERAARPAPAAAPSPAPPRPQPRRCPAGGKRTCRDCRAWIPPRETLAFLFLFPLFHPAAFQPPLALPRRLPPSPPARPGFPFPSIFSFLFFIIIFFFLGK